MRFTRIPIIATLLAGALSLLFLLPAFGQTTGDLERTEGRERSGDLEVGVFSTVGDAQVAKLQRTPYPAGSPTRVFYASPGSNTAIADTATGAIGAGITATIGEPVATGVAAGTLRSADDPAFLVRSPETVETSTPRIDIPGNYVETRNTSFAGSLYVGARKSADAGPNVLNPDYNATGDGGYNAVLVSFLDEETRTTPCADTDGDNYPVAIVSNPSRNYTIRVPLFPTTTSGEDATGEADSGEYIQAFFLVADDTQTSVELTRENRQRNGPHCSDDTGSGVTEFAQIAARHGDRLTVRIASEASNISLIVDAEGPEINLISPVDGSSVKPNSLNFRFDVRDPDSGLRHDGEFTLSGDGDPASINPDRDAVRGGEPLSEMTASLFAGGNGKAADIQAVYWELGDRGSRLEDADRSDDITDQGSWTIIGGRAGVGYSFSAQGNNFDDADNNFQLTAMDRVGNMTISDADFETTDVNEPYIFEVDSEVPTVGDVRTGISYRNDDDEEVVDRSAISLEFSEPVKSGDVVASRITVIGNSVVGVIQPDGAPKVYRGQNGEVDPDACTTAEEVPDTDPQAEADAMVPNPNKCPGTDILGAGIAETRNLVFLQLGTPLAADAKPDVSLLSGAVQDLAGNDIATVTQTSEDWIAPTLTVTVTGTKGDRPIANSEGEFVVEVTSDEDLSGRPRVIFAEIVGKDNRTDTNPNPDPRYSYSIGDGISGQTSCNLTPQEADNTWRRSCDVGGRIDSSITGMVGVFVLATDEDNRNLAVSPVKWEGTSDAPAPTHQAPAIPSPGEGAAVDAKELHDAGLLIEIDNVFNAAKVDVEGLDDTQTQGAQMSPDESVTPRSGDDDKKTESPNPFIHIDFTGENDEYGVGTYRDSHGKVTITEIKLNDEDAMDQLSSVAKDEFSVVLRELPVGKHTLTYKAKDDAGNEYNDGEFKFEVLQRKPYKLNVNPGWNLISLPGAPDNTAIADVLADTEFLTPVLAYQNGDWLTARRTDDNGWDGSLTDIEAGYGYWVHAQTFETIETLLTEIDPASVPPTVPVARGWNLLGVIDVDQRADGQAPGTGDNADGEADNYFNSIPWKVAYSYDTQRSVWTRYTPDAGVACSAGAAEPADNCVDEILNGNGYWVWSERPSTLVP